MQEKRKYANFIIQHIQVKHKNVEIKNVIKGVKNEININVNNLIKVYLNELHALRLKQDEINCKMTFTCLTMRRLYNIAALKSYTEATTAGVDPLWTKGICSSHPKPLLVKMKTAGQGCGFRSSSKGLFGWQLKLLYSQLTVV